MSALPKKLDTVFNKYAGRTALHPMAMGICQTLTAIETDAAREGLGVRPIYDNQPVSLDINPNRLNVHIDFDGQQHRVTRLSLG